MSYQEWLGGFKCSMHEFTHLAAVAIKIRMSDQLQPSFCMRKKIKKEENVIACAKYLCNG